MKRAFGVIAVALLLVLTSCSSARDTYQNPSQSTSAAGETEFLATHGLAGMDGKEIIDHLDRMPVADRATDLMAAVQPNELVLSDADQEISIALNDDEFYVSVAPYIEQTHDCFYHSLTTCRGELANQEVDVTITGESGDVLFKETVTTFDNGFVGVWLPADTDGTISVTYDGRTGQSDFSTTDDGATCVTTLQLKA